MPDLDAEIFQRNSNIALGIVRDAIGPNCEPLDVLSAVLQYFGDGLGRLITELFTQAGKTLDFFTFGKGLDATFSSANAIISPAPIPYDKIDELADFIIRPSGSGQETTERQRSGVAAALRPCPHQDHPDRDFRNGHFQIVKRRTCWITIRNPLNRFAALVGATGKN